MVPCIGVPTPTDGFFPSFVMTGSRLRNSVALAFCCWKAVKSCQLNPPRPTFPGEPASWTRF